MSNNYDYISVSTDSELMEAYKKVMSEATDHELKLQMAKASDYPFWKLFIAIRQICNESTRIKELVNKQIEDKRTLESIERQGKHTRSGVIEPGYIKITRTISKPIYTVAGLTDRPRKKFESFLKIINRFRFP